MNNNLFNSLFAITLAIQPLLTTKATLIKGKHWQIETPLPKTEPEIDQSNQGSCPVGMVQVRGQMKQDPSSNPYSTTVEFLQKTTCIEWINKEYPERCAVFDRDKWLEISKELPTKPFDFCIDRYEFPNEAGKNPIIFVNYWEAKGLCEEKGKRLCSETEWTFACEGEEAMPYPYGYVRDANACVIDKQWRLYNAQALRDRDSPEAKAELERLWQGEPSGSRVGCKSPFGVYDLTGNVDEWVTAVGPSKYKSVLAGGYWGPVRTRCRPKTRSHNENHVFYQQGVRCCSDI